MRILSNARRLARVLRPPSILLDSHHPLLSSYSSLQGQHRHNASSVDFTGMRQGGYLHLPQHPICLMMSRKSLSSEAGTITGNPTEGVKELYDKMIESVNVKRTMPPNAWLWSLLESCKNHEDIELLFDILKNLRRFRLSNLRIHENFNCNLCREVTKTCVRVGELDFGKKALWKHNMYGLTPAVGSAHQLLLYAKDHNDVNLMVEVMDLLKKNNLPLQPGTADIVFRICYDTDNWELISKYAKRFVMGGAKLRKTSFDTWMKFAAKRGDTESLWRIEKLRAETVKQHSVSSGFSCAKSGEKAAIDGGRMAHIQGALPLSMGFLLERKPQDAADIIQLLDQTLPDSKRSAITDELEKLVNEWPFEVIKHQKDEDRKALAASLKSDIPAMVGLLSSGSAVRVNLEDLDKNEIPC